MSTDRPDRQDILKKISWKEGEEWFGTCEIELPLLGGDVMVRFLVEQEGTISERSAEIFHDLFDLTEADLVEIKGFLRKNYELSRGDEDYGITSDDGPFEKSFLRYIVIDEENEEYEGNFSLLMFDADWHSHLCAVVVQDGEVVGFGEDGLYLGKF